MSTALLFDRDRVDTVDDWQHLIDRLGRRSILWIDLESPDQREATDVVEKVLTLGSLLFLPGALLAGVLGMNFEVGLFAHTALFWVVVGFMISLMVAVLVAARVRKWI